MPRKRNLAGAGRPRKRGLTKRQVQAKRDGIAPDSDTRYVADRLRHHITREHISPSKLALRAKVHSAVVYAYVDPERYGLKSMNLSIVRSLAEALGLSLHELVHP